MGFLYVFMTLIASYALQVANAPKPQNATAGTLDVPEPKPGSFVPVVYGTNVIKSATVISYFDAQTVPIKASGGK